MNIETVNVLGILLHLSLLGPPWLGPEENLQSVGSQNVGKHYFDWFM